MSTSPQPKDTNNAAWIARKIKAALSHYPVDWSAGEELQQDVLDTWVDFLSPFSKMAIEQALTAHLRDEPTTKPTPGAIRQRAHGTSSGGSNGIAVGGDRDTLSPDERDLLEHKVLPTARRWLSIPGLADSGRQTLAYWGEPV